MSISAIEFLERAADLMLERGVEYDKQDGERSMAQTVAAFNVMTGNILSEQEGWLFMLILKLVRQQTTDVWHQDSYEDARAYAALKLGRPSGWERVVEVDVDRDCMKKELIEE